MQNDISQAMPEAPIIPEAEAEVQTPEEGSESEQSQTEAKLTLEDYRKIAREEATRIAQSQVAKSENRQHARIQERFAALERERSTLKLTDDQVLEAQEAIIKDEQRKAYLPGPRPENDQAHQPPIAEFESEFMSGIETIFEDAGVRVMPDDPEWKGVQKEWENPNGNPAKTYAAIGKAAAAKAARLASLKDGAKARVLGGGGSSNPNDISGITDSKELYRMGEAKLSKK